MIPSTESSPPQAFRSSPSGLLSSGAPARFRLRCAFGYGAAVAVSGILLPYLPAWLQYLSLTPFEIGIVLAVQMALKVMAAPLAGMLTRRIRDPAMLLIWCGGLSLLTALAMIATHSFWPVLIVFGIQSALFAPYTPVVEAIAVTGVRRWGFPYGSMRVWGSIGFVGTSLSIGFLIGHFGPGIVPTVLALSFIVTMAAGLTAPRLGETMRRSSHGVDSSKGVDVADTSATNKAAGSQSDVLRRADLHVLMFGASLAQASHGMFYAFGTLDWHAAGLSSGQIGILWTAGVLAEITVFLLAGRIARKVSNWTLMRVGCIAAVLRWAVFPLPLGFSGFLVLQVMHAFTFAFLHVGLQGRLVETVAEAQQPSAQGAYIFYNGALLGLSTVLSGVMYRQFGSAGYLSMSVIAICGLAIVVLASRLHPQSDASGG